MINIELTIDESEEILRVLKNDMIVMKTPGLYHLYTELESRVPVEKARIALQIAESNLKREQKRKGKKK